MLVVLLHASPMVRAGSLKPDRHVRYASGTPLTNLCLALLERAGTPTRSLGDRTGPLKGLA